MKRAWVQTELFANARPAICPACGAGLAERPAAGRIIQCPRCRRGIVEDSKGKLRTAMSLFDMGLLGRISNIKIRN